MKLKLIVILALIAALGAFCYAEGEDAPKDQPAETETVAEADVNAPVPAEAPAKDAEEAVAEAPAEESKEGAAVEAEEVSEPAAEKADEEAPADEPVKEEIPEQPVWSWMKQTADYEVIGSFLYIVPAESDWDSAMGFDLTFRWWFDESWGFGAGVGYTMWDFAAGELEHEAIVATPMDVEGDAVAYPLSLFGSFRHDLTDDIELVLDGGIRYVLVDSEVEVSVSYRDHFGRDATYTAYVDNENQFLGSVGGALRGDINDNGLWLIGVEYQFGISDPDPNWLLQDLGNDFSGFITRVGLGIQW